MKRAAIIGMGAIFETHLQALKETQAAQLCAVCDIDPAKAALAPGVPFYTDYRCMLEQEKPDSVHICLPHDLHLPVAEDCARAGCHVLCEKPLANTLAAAEKLAALEEEFPDQVLSLCLQNRWNPSFGALRAALDSGDYGQLRGVRALVAWARPKTYYEKSPWRGQKDRAGSGVLLNQSIHTLDLMLQLTGPVQSVQAGVSRLLDYGIEVEDTVSAVMKFESGVQGVFFGTVANTIDQATELWAFTEKTNFLLRGGKLFRQDADGAFTLLVQDDEPVAGKFYYGSSHRLLIDQFYKAMEDRSIVYTHLRDGLPVARLIDAMLNQDVNTEAEREPI